MFKISGCDVYFPHQPYGVQLSFMNKVITSLEAGNNALLEAPTGKQGLSRPMLGWSANFCVAYLHPG